MVQSMFAGGTPLVVHGGLLLKCIGIEIFVLLEYLYLSSYIVLTLAEQTIHSGGVHLACIGHCTTVFMCKQ